MNFLTLIIIIDVVILAVIVGLVIAAMWEWKHHR